MKNNRETFLKYASLSMKFHYRICNSDVFGGSGTVGYIEVERPIDVLNKDFLKLFNDDVFDSNKEEIMRNLKVEENDISLISSDEYSKCAKCIKDKSKFLIQ